RLKIRIPANIWNAYQPSTKTNPAKKSPRKLTLRLRFPPAPPPSNKIREVKGRNRKDLGNNATSCKVKLFRFHHGGPHRQRKGKWQNMITYEQPCLHLTCMNCWRWHAHLL
ncbi:hypothetical protein BKA58DRAFT_297054, partial [Alternaria rosae]|uniref:uncharacterized protein n=1 Tax=Alternaria rosae TaxID=1187941 RepID=UPI001E8E0FEA